MLRFCTLTALCALEYNPPSPVHSPFSRFGAVASPRVLQAFVCFSACASDPPIGITSSSRSVGCSSFALLCKPRLSHPLISLLFSSLPHRSFVSNKMVLVCTYVPPLLSQFTHSSSTLSFPFFFPCYPPCPFHPF